MVDARIVKRLPNWQERFHNFILANMRARPEFTWDPTSIAGYNCLTFADANVEALTGLKLYDLIAGDLAYDTPLSAYKAMKALGYNSVDQILGSVFKGKRITHLHPGDLVLLDNSWGVDGADELRQTVGVADPPFYWHVSTIGLSKGDMFEAKKAYAVG